jgi:hypothetical protein
MVSPVLPKVNWERAPICRVARNRNLWALFGKKVVDLYILIAKDFLRNDCQPRRELNNRKSTPTLEVDGQDSPRRKMP